MIWYNNTINIFKGKIMAAEQKKILEGKINEETIQKLAELLHKDVTEVYLSVKDQLVSRCTPEFVEAAYKHLKNRFHWASDKRIATICSSNYSWLACSPEKQDEKIDFFTKTFYDGNIHETEKHANASYTKYSKESILETMEFYRNLLHIKNQKELVRFFKKNMSLITIGNERGQKVFNEAPSILGCDSERTTEILTQYPRLFNMSGEELHKRIEGIADALGCSMKEAQMVATTNPRAINTSSKVLKETVNSLNEIGFDNNAIFENTILLSVPVDGLKLRYMFAASKGLKIDAHGVLMMNLKTTYARYNYMLEHEGPDANFNLISQAKNSFHSGDRKNITPLEMLELYPLDEKAIAEIEKEYQHYKQGRESQGIKVPDLRATDQDINFALTSKTKAEMEQVQED